MKLTKVQEIAVRAEGIPVIVSAGAGTGKTRVLVERFIHFIQNANARVTEILALTFTEKAAAEMKSRIMQRLLELGLNDARRDLESAYISTLHAFGARLLKEHPVEACVHPDFRVMESDAALLVQEEILEALLEEIALAGSGIFQLLKTYGEENIRNAVFKVHQAARVEGRGLEEFFKIPGALEEKIPDVLHSGEILFSSLGENELLENWRDFMRRSDWTWQDVRVFQEWIKPFSRKRKEKEKWQEILRLANERLAAQFEIFSKPWRGYFETLALEFERRYEQRKQEEGWLDFQDLEIKTVQLLSRDRPGNVKIRERYLEKFKWIMVDEFQDTNPLQLRLVETLAGPGGQGRLFYVGDYKQSIYSFRGTSPVHFLEKEKAYSDGKSGLRIPMLENFRTTPAILNFINPFFERLWEEDNIPAEGLAAMKEDACGAVPEVLVIRQEEKESLEEARLREAAWLARRIQGLYEEGFAYGEMAVLFQAMTNVTIYEQALKNAGIPYFVVSGRGFYHQPEIRDMMSLLDLLENPLLDIPLAAVLRSPFFRVSDEGLFWLAQKAKEKDENAPLFEVLKRFRPKEEICKENPAEKTIPELSSKDREALCRFPVFFEKLLAEKDGFYISELLERIIAETEYNLWALHDRQGVRRYSNLKKLVEIARQLESNGRISLGEFIRTLRSLELREVRESEAQIETEESGRVVRLMTIHAAKGLEFPVCILADLGQKGNRPESRHFLADPSRGYALKIPHENRSAWEEPASYLEIDRILCEKENSEWKRLFYVAMTRAQYRLLMSGVYKEKKEDRSEGRFSEMDSWMEWVIKGTEGLGIRFLETDSSFAPFRKPPSVPAEETLFQQAIGTEDSGRENGLLNDKENGFFSEQAAGLLARFRKAEILRPRAIDLPVSAYCAFAKDPLDYWRIYELGYKDSFWKKEKALPEEDENGGSTASAADFGTAVHRVLEQIDFQRAERMLSGIVEKVLADFSIDERNEAVRFLNAFFQSSVFQKIKAAKKIYKELGFFLNERHGRIDGVIDLLFQDEAGKWHVFDYKTAVGDMGKVQEAHYDLQLSIYALAIREITGEIPAWGGLYFLKNQWLWETAFDHESLEKCRERLQALQEAILSYRWEKQEGKEVSSKPL